MQSYGLKAVRKKKRRRNVVRTAERPGQAINIDICYVPEQHTAQEPLPAVSGSSGRLIVERICTQAETPQWPGQIFAEAGLDYEEAMRQYAQATRDRLTHSKVEKIPKLEQPTRWRKEWDGRAERYQVRQQRKQEDLAWKTAKAQWREARLAFQALARNVRREQKAAFEYTSQIWQQARKQRQESVDNRKRENLAWHQRNQALKLDSNAEARVWIAILVVTDNCTRQCLGLPVFRSGSKLTSAEVVTALRTLLPKELQFLISDQGTHFRSNGFAQFVEDENFTHIPVYRHRPQSNGIAERFVLTLKNWLCDKAWETVTGLENWLVEFFPFYNNRPHQNLPIPGLSPYEFAQRIWLM